MLSTQEAAATLAAVSEDPFVELVDHLTRVFRTRHAPTVVAQVTLQCWTEHRDRCRGFDDPAFETLVRTRLTLMPPSTADDTPAASALRSWRVRQSSSRAGFLRADGDR